LRSAQAAGYYLARRTQIGEQPDFGDIVIRESANLDIAQRSSPSAGADWERRPWPSDLLESFHDDLVAELHGLVTFGAAFLRASSCASRAWRFASMRMSRVAGQIVKLAEHETGANERDQRSGARPARNEQGQAQKAQPSHRYDQKPSQLSASHGLPPTAVRW
jgi:hypothetical protein